jgi:nitroreductase
MDVLDAIKDRRSVPFFKYNSSVPDAIIKQLIELANLAPSSFNLQPWRVIVVRDPERKKTLRQVALNQSKIEEASHVLIVIADPDIEVNLIPMLDSWEKLGYIKRENRGDVTHMVRLRYGDEGSTERAIFAAKNAALFAMTLMIAAQGLGLQTHAMDGFDEEPLKQAFHIPGDKIVIMLIAIGYPRQDFVPLPRAFRRSPIDFVGFESY